MKWPSAPTLMMGAVAGIGVFALVRIAKAKSNAPQTTAPQTTDPPLIVTNQLDDNGIPIRDAGDL